MSLIETTRGDHRTLTFTVRDAAGVIVNITGFSIRFTVKRLRSTADPGLITKTVGSGVTITNGAGGICTVALVPADTSLLSGVYWWDLQVTDGSSATRTVADGRFYVKKDVGVTVP